MLAIRIRIYDTATFYRTYFPMLRPVITVLIKRMFLMVAFVAALAAFIAFPIRYHGVRYVFINSIAMLAYMPMVYVIRNPTTAKVMQMVACVAAFAAFIAFPIRHHGVRYVSINSIAMLAFMPMVYVIRNPITAKVMQMVAFVAAHAAFIAFPIRHHGVWTFIHNLVALLACLQVVRIIYLPPPVMVTFVFPSRQCNGLYK